MDHILISNLRACMVYFFCQVKCSLKKMVIEMETGFIFKLENYVRQNCAVCSYDSAILAHLLRVSRVKN